MTDCEAYEESEGLQSWRDLYYLLTNKPSGQEPLPEYLKVVEQVVEDGFVLALGGEIICRPVQDDDMLDGYVWSFCNDGWVDSRQVRHCTKCNMCYENAWHCNVCGICKLGRELACSGCQGWSRAGAEKGQESGWMAVDAEAMQIEKDGSNRKRSRHETQAGQCTEVRVFCSAVVPC